MSVFQLHTHLQEQSTTSVRRALQRVRAAFHQKEIDRGGIDGLPPAGDMWAARRPRDRHREEPEK